MRFFCFRHSTPVSRFSQPQRKRGADALDGEALKENIPNYPTNNVGPTQPKVSTPSRSPKKASGMETSCMWGAGVSSMLKCIIEKKKKKKKL